MKCISLFKCYPQIEVIDKSHCKLEDVPNFQNYSRSLEELFLDTNNLTQLNDNVFKLTKLRRLSFSDNAIQDVPPDIAKLVNLIELDASKNMIQEIPEQIKFLRGLKVCDFGTNSIEYLPPGLMQLKHLTSLTLKKCIITHLPDDIGLLKNLEYLDLRENALEYLPASISSLENLKKLDLGENMILKLPDDIGRLTKLEYLLLDTNRLETVPIEIGRLENLQCLDLEKQKPGLRALPEQISGLINLTDLHLSENHLQSLPDGIRCLKNLTILKVDNNYLSELNPNIGGCVLLQELVLTSNQIMKLPSSIGNLTDMYSFNVDRNLLKELPTQIGQLKSLGLMSLRDNLLTHIPNEIGYLDLLRVLDLSGNCLEYLPINITNLNLKALWLSKNQAQPLPRLQIDQLPNSDETKVLTCYLLPQQSEDSDDSAIEQNEHQNQHMDAETFEARQRQAAVSFDTAAIDDVELDENAQFVRHDTPHPRELKARHHKLFTSTATGTPTTTTTTTTTSSKPELKGLDNACFALADGNDSYNTNNNNNDREYEQKQSNLAQTYRPLEYESNGLPEVPPPSTRMQSGHVQTTSKLFEAFRQKSSDYPMKTSTPKTAPAAYDHNDHFKDSNLRHHTHENGSTHEQKLLQGNRGFEVITTTTTKGIPEYGGDNLESARYVMDIHVRRADHHKPGLGLSIAGGKDTPPFKDNDEGIFVSKVTRGGPAEAAGVKMGDKILAVNDHIFYEGITHQRAVEIFKKIKPDFREFSIRVLRDPDDEYIDEQKLNDEQNDVIGLFANRDNVSSNNNNYFKSSFNDKTAGPVMNQSTFTRTYTMPIKSESNGSSGGAAGGGGTTASNLKQFLMSKDQERTKTNASTLPPGMSLTDGSVTRNNIIYTTLVKDYKRDLGLVLENRNDTDHDTDNDNSKSTSWSNIVISHIKPDSIASRDGKLQPDDRLISINGADVTGVDLERILLMLEGTERFIRIVVSRGDADDPLGVALRNMPTRPSLGSWFSSTTNMSHRPSLIESYQRPTFGSVSSLSKQNTSQLLGTKPQKPPKPTHLTKDNSEDSEARSELDSDNPIAKPRSKSNSLLQQQQQVNTQISDAERRAAWRRERLKSIEDDVEMAKLIAEAQRRRREEK